MASDPQRNRITYFERNSGFATRYPSLESMLFQHRQTILTVQQPLWIDIFQPNFSDLQWLKSTYSLHPLTIDDCSMFRGGRQKTEVYEHYLFVVYACLTESFADSEFFQNEFFSDETKEIPLINNDKIFDPPQNPPLNSNSITNGNLFILLIGDTIITLHHHLISPIISQVTWRLAMEYANKFQKAKSILPSPRIQSHFQFQKFPKSPLVTALTPSSNELKVTSNDIILEVPGKKMISTPLETTVQNIDKLLEPAKSTTNSSVQSVETGKTDISMDLVNQTSEKSPSVNIEPIDSVNTLESNIQSPTSNSDVPIEIPKDNSPPADPKNVKNTNTLVTTNLVATNPPINTNKIPPKENLVNSNPSPLNTPDVSKLTEKILQTTPAPENNTLVPEITVDPPENSSSSSKQPSTSPPDTTVDPPENSSTSSKQPSTSPLDTTVDPSENILKISSDQTNQVPNNSENEETNHNSRHSSSSFDDNSTSMPLVNMIRHQTRIFDSSHIPPRPRKRSYSSSSSESFVSSNSTFSQSNNPLAHSTSLSADSLEKSTSVLHFSDILVDQGGASGTNPEICLPVQKDVVQYPFQIVKTPQLLTGRKLFFPSTQWLLYAFLAEVASRYEHYVSSLLLESHTIDELVRDLSISEYDDVYDRVNRALRATSALYRLITPQREVLQNLLSHLRREERSFSRLIKTAPGKQLGILARHYILSFHYIRDVLDHTESMISDIQLTRETLHSSQNSYNARITLEMSRAGQILNEATQKMSVAATIFLPITALTSLFGVNVQVPGQDDPSSVPFYIMTVFLCIQAAIIAYYFRKKGWW